MKTNEIERSPCRALRRSIVLGVGLAIAGPSAPAVAASPASAPSESAARDASDASDASAAQEGLRIIVEPAIDDAHLIQQWIRSRSTKEGSAVPELQGHEQWVEVYIGGSTYDYRVTVAAFRDGKPLVEEAEPQRCECTTEQLLELVGGRIDGAVADLEAAKPVEEAEEDERSKKEIVASTTDEPSDDTRPRRVGAKGAVGIAMVVLGAGAVGGGTALWLRPDELRGDIGGYTLKVARRPAIGLWGGGGAVLVTGIALLAVDVAQRRRKQGTVVVPTLGPRHAGVTITRRF